MTAIAPPMMPRQRSASIDALRAIAAFAVLLNHLPFSTAVAARDGTAGSAFPSWMDAALNYGQYGVHLFLVISGFAIHLAAARAGTSSEVSFANFWRRRMVRLYPPYFVALLMTLAGLLVLFGRTATSLPGMFGYESASQLAVDLVLLVFLLQNLNGASHRVGNGPFWSLALEEQLYALYFPLLWLRKRMPWTQTLAIVLVVTLGWRLVGILLGFDVEWFIVGPARWFEWVLGAIAVEAYLGNTALPRWCSSPWVSIAVLGTACVLVAPDVAPRASALLGDSLFGLGFFVLINALSARERVGPPSSVIDQLAPAGAWSYSLYLTHVLVMAGAKQLGLRVGLPIWGITAARLVAPLLFAYGFYRLLEQPFVRRARRMADTTRPRTATSGVS